MLKNDFGFAVHREKSSNGFGFRLSITRNKNTAVLIEFGAFADGRSQNDNIHWRVPDYTPSISQEIILSKQTSSKAPTKLRYIERFVSMKDVIIHSLWSFELGSQKSMNVPEKKIVRSQQRDRHDSQNLNKAPFCRLPVSSAQCVKGKEKIPDVRISLK